MMIWIVIWLLVWIIVILVPELGQALYAIGRFCTSAMIWLLLIAVIGLTVKLLSTTSTGQMFLAVDLMGAWLVYFGCRLYALRHAIMFQWHYFRYRRPDVPPIIDPYASTRQWLRGLRFTESNR